MRNIKDIRLKFFTDMQQFENKVVIDCLGTKVYLFNNTCTEFLKLNKIK